MQIDQMIRAVQKAVGVEVDGKAGPRTWSAIYAALVKQTIASKPPLEAIGKVDARSERNIAGLLPQAQPFARALVQKAAANDIDIRILSGLRTYEEQDALFAQGRSRPGPKVTNARGGYSSHNFGIAFDVGVFSGNRYLGESDKYRGVGVLGTDMGLEWGGNWTSLVDQPHFQLRPAWAGGMRERDMLAELRRRRDAGVAVYD